MSGFRTALVICGILIMAFVTLWSMFEQRRSMVGRYSDGGRTGSRRAKTGDPVPDSDSSAQDAVNKRQSPERSGGDVQIEIEPGAGAPGPAAGGRFGLNRRFGRTKAADNAVESAGIDTPGDPISPPQSRWRRRLNAGRDRLSGRRQARADVNLQQPENAISGILVDDPADQRKTPRLSSAPAGGAGFGDASIEAVENGAVEIGAVEDAHWTEHNEQDLSGRVEHQFNAPQVNAPQATQPLQSGVQLDAPERASLSSTTGAGFSTTPPEVTPPAKKPLTDRWRARLPRFGPAADTGAARSATQRNEKIKTKENSSSFRDPESATAGPASTGIGTANGGEFNLTADVEASANNNRANLEEHPAAAGSSLSVATGESGAANVTREERTMFKRTDGRTDRVDRTRGSKGASEVGRPVARQTSSASLWAGNKAGNRSPEGRANRNSRVANGGARRRNRDSLTDAPARAAGKDGFRSRYSQAQRRSRDKTQAVRDSSLPSRARSQSKENQETGVFANLLGRISSAVSGPRSRQASAAASHERARAPGRRNNPLSRDETTDQREPRLTVSSLDQIPEDRMILPGAAEQNYAPGLQRDSLSNQHYGQVDEAGHHAAHFERYGEHDGSEPDGYGVQSSHDPSLQAYYDPAAAEHSGDLSSRFSDRDNRQNIDAVQAGSARGGRSVSSSGYDSEQTRRELQRELDAAEDVATEPLKPQFDLSKIDTSRQIDQIAQIVELEAPARRDDVLSIYRINEGRIAKPIRIIGLSAIDNSWVDLEQEPETGEYTEIVLTVQIYDVDGPVDESTLHRFSDIVLQTADRIGGRPRFAMSFEDALDHAGSLELFCKDYDRLAILSVVVGETSRISGEPLSEFAESRGLVLNSMNIFHRPNSDPDGSPWRFGIANLFEPGTFNLDPDSGFETRGLRLFMSIPTVREPEKVFDDMVVIAQDLCQRFSGTIVDQSKRPLTEQGIADIRSQMVAVTEEMRGYGFAPGDENTIRIFPQFGQD